MSRLSPNSEFQLGRAEDRYISRQAEERRRRLQRLMSAMSGHQQDETPGQQSPSTSDVNEDFGRRQSSLRRMFPDEESSVPTIRGNRSSTSAAQAAISDPTGGPYFSRSGSAFSREINPSGHEALTIRGPGAQNQERPLGWMVRPTAEESAAGIPGEITIMGKPATPEEEARGVERAGMRQSIEDARRKALGLEAGQTPEEKATRGRYRSQALDVAADQIEKQVLEATGDAAEAALRRREFIAQAEGLPETAGDAAARLAQQQATEAVQGQYTAGAIGRKRQKEEAALALAQANAANAGAKQGNIEADRAMRTQAEANRMALGKQRLAQAAAGEQHRLDAQSFAAVQRAVAAKDLNEYRQAVLDLQRQRQQTNEEKLRQEDPSLDRTLAERDVLQAAKQALASGDRAAIQNALAQLDRFPKAGGGTLADIDEGALDAEVAARDARVRAAQERYDMTHPVSALDQAIIDAMGQQ